MFLLKIGERKKNVSIPLQTGQLNNEEANGTAKFKIPSTAREKFVKTPNFSVS